MRRLHPSVGTWHLTTPVSLPPERAKMSKMCNCGDDSNRWSAYSRRPPPLFIGTHVLETHHLLSTCVASRCKFDFSFGSRMFAARIQLLQTRSEDPLFVTSNHMIPCKFDFALAYWAGQSFPHIVQRGVSTPCYDTIVPLRIHPRLCDRLTAVRPTSLARSR